MKRVLISGCSYGVYIDKKFSKLVFENYFQEEEEWNNISQNGSSLPKSINRCYEWTAIYGFPDLLILPVTHLSRYELPIAKEKQDYDTESISWKIGHTISEKEYHEKILPVITLNDLQKFLEIYDKIYLSNMSFVSGVVRDLIGFANWLKLKECRHMIFNMANPLDIISNRVGPGLEKLHWLKTSRNIYKFFDFCANEWLWNQLNIAEKQKLEDYNIGLSNPSAVHHAHESYAKLMQYLIKEILETNLDK